jgi:serine/threonine-protein kinase
MAEAELVKPVQPEPRLGSYRLIRQLGSGGMSSVFKGIHVDNGLEVAVKVLPRYLAKNPTLLQRFLREARNAEALEHPNIVAIYDRGNDEGRYYLILEYVAGGDLHDRVRNHGPLGIAETVRVALAVAQGLRYAAGRGVIHRDVKPANLLLAPDGHVKITDLGLALQVADDDERVTRDGTTVGTVDYMAPEQARDSRATSDRSDIYSLGCTLYYALTGQPPFAGGDITEKLRRHAVEPPPDVRQLRPEVPAPLALLVRRMMAKDPEARYADYDQLIAALDALPVADDVDDGLPALVPLDDEPDFTLGPGRSSGSNVRAPAGSTAEASTVQLPGRPGRSSGTVASGGAARPVAAPAPPRPSARATAESVAPMLRQLDEEPEPGLPPPVYGSATFRARRDPTTAYIITGLVIGGGVALLLLLSQWLWPLIAGRGPAAAAASTSTPTVTSEAADGPTSDVLAFPPDPGESSDSRRP